MFDIGWSELLIIAVVTIIVIGPKELPRVLRNLGRAVGAVRRTANDFRHQVEEALRESELEDLRKEFEGAQAANPLRGVEHGIGGSLEPVGSEAEPAPKPSPKRARKPAAGKTASRGKSAPAKSKSAKAAAKGAPSGRKSAAAKAPRKGG